MKEGEDAQHVLSKERLAELGEQAPFEAELVPELVERVFHLRVLLEDLAVGEHAVSGDPLGHGVNDLGEVTRSQGS